MGQVQVKTQPLIVKNEAVREAAEDVTTEKTNFLYLSLDLPPMPLFKDTEGGNIIPQVRAPLVTCWGGGGSD